MLHLSTNLDWWQFHKHYHWPLFSHMTNSNLQNEKCHHLIQWKKRDIWDRWQESSGHFNTLSHSSDDHSIMVIERMKSEDSNFRKKRERATGFIIYSHCPHQGWNRTHIHVIVVYITSIYAAGIMLDYEQFLYTDMCDVFCLYHI